MPITYSNSNIIRQKKYYRDFFCESYEAQFKKENTMIVEGKLATKNYGITYKKNISKFEDEVKNSNQQLNINKEIYDEESNGLVIGNYFGSFLFGVHQERIKINSRIKTSLSSEINYTSEYYKPTYGIITPFKYFFISATYQPEIKTTFKRLYTKGINYTIPSKSIYGIQLYLKNFEKYEPKFAFDFGRTQSIEGHKTAEGVSPKSNLIKGELVSFKIGDYLNVIYSKKEFPLGDLQIKKMFSSLNVNYWGQWSFGYNEFSITDKSGKTFGYKYPEFSVNFKFDFGKSDDATEKEECEDPLKNNVLTSCK
jgi:hypothetical protein